MFRSSVLLFALLGALAPPALAQIFPLEVINASEHPRIGEVARVSIPIPEDIPIHDPHAVGLVVRDPSGRVIPSQFRVLSRWHGPRDDMSKGAKWILAAFPVDVPANTTLTYRLAVGQAPQAGIDIVDDPSRLVVMPRPGAAFVIDKTRFSIFEQVQIDGRSLLSAPGELRVRGMGGVNFPVTLTETVIEVDGPVLTTVRQKGSIGPLAFTARAHFQIGMDEVRYDFRLENPGAYGVFESVPSATVYLQELVLDLPVRGADSRFINSRMRRTLTGSRFELRQDHLVGGGPDHWNSFSYTEMDGANLVGTGGRHDGGAAVAGQGGGVLIAVDRFFQNFPKAFAKEGDHLEVHLWPAGGNGPHYKGIYGRDPIDPNSLMAYRIEGGRWKTHTMGLRFQSTIPSPAEVRSLVDRTAHPLIGRVKPRWTKHSLAIPALWHEDDQGTDLAASRWRRMVGMLADDAMADDLRNEGRVGVRAFMKRGGTWRNRLHYGWENYGDLRWSEGASSLHYDWTLAPMLNFVRTGDYGFWDIGRDMIAHRRDYDTNHTTDLRERWRGAAFYEKGEWHGSYRFGEASHTWLHGLLLHYALTGDEGTYETVLASVDFLLRSEMRNWHGNWGSRIPGWTMDNLTVAYAYLGMQAAKVEAGEILLNYERLEVAAGARGYVPNEGDRGRVKPWMVNIFFNGAVRYMAVTQDYRGVGLIDRMRNWLRNDVIVRAGVQGSLVQLPGVIYQMDRNGNAMSHSLHKGWPMLESMAWSYLLSGDTQDAIVAMELWNSLILFHQRSVGQQVNPGDTTSYSPISMRIHSYPDTETKVMGQVLLWGQAGLALQRILERRW